MKRLAGSFVLFWALASILLAISLIPERCLASNIPKTVRIGTGLKTGEEFLRAMLDNKCGVSYYGRKMILSPDFKIAEKEAVLAFTVVSVQELGFNKDTKLADIYAEAKKRYLAPCPAEVGPQLRMQYKDQPVGEVLVVAMEKISLPTGFSGIFGVEHPEPTGLFLYGGNDGEPEALYPLNTRFVFIKTK